MSKYNNEKVVMYGIAFDSRREAKRYRELCLLERAGKITELELQKKFVLIPTQREQTGKVFKQGPRKGEPKPGKVIEKECAYIADFAYKANGQMVVEDTKGYKTKDYLIKRKLMLYVHGIRIREV